jgi:hypothetical protein
MPKQVRTRGSRCCNSSKKRTETERNGRLEFQTAFYISQCALSITDHRICLGTPTKGVRVSRVNFNLRVEVLNGLLDPADIAGDNRGNRDQTYTN